MPDQLNVIASCHGNGEGGGGCFLLRDGHAERIDDLSTMGLYATSDERLLRVMWSPGREVSVGAEVLVYDRHGVQRYLRADCAAEAHDVIMDADGRIVVASTADTRVVWLDGDATARRIWTPHPGRSLGDTWHINGLLVADDTVYFTCFGMYDHHREFDQRPRDEGVLFDLERARPVVTGLARPHTPRIVDGHWLICNSANSELLRISRDTLQTVQTVPLDGFTRGCCTVGDRVYVGESSHRGEHADGPMAKVAVLDRATFELVDRIDLPCHEIYDLVAVSDDVLSGLRTGFNTNAHRAQENTRGGMMRPGENAKAAMAPLDARDALVRIAIPRPPEAVAAGHLETVDVTVTNLGTRPFTSVGPHPVHLSGRLHDADTGQVVDELPRTPLRTPLQPGSEVTMPLQLHAPVKVGVYVAAVTLVQEHVRWFDDHEPDNRYLMPFAAIPAGSTAA